MNLVQQPRQLLDFVYHDPGAAREGRRRVNIASITAATMLAVYTGITRPLARLAAAFERHLLLEAIPE